MSEFCVGECLGCRNVDKTIEFDENLKRAQAEIEKQACDESLDLEIAPACYEELMQRGVMFGFPGSEAPIESPEDLAKIMRMQSAAVLEHIATQREALALAVTGLTRNCRGPLKMRAKRDGKTVIVTACMSPTAPEGSEAEEVYVHRITNSDC